MKRLLAELLERLRRTWGARPAVPVYGWSEPAIVVRCERVIEA